MSRFWAGASSSDSDDSSGDDSSYYSSEGEQGKATNANNRWVEFSDSDSDESEKRQVLSSEDRMKETFNKHIANLRKAMKDRDYYTIQTEFDELAKAMLKNKKNLQKGIPKPVVRILVDLEEYVPERLSDKAAFKKLSARQGRALNRMKLTLKKHNKPYAVVMEHYRSNPDTGDDDEAADGNESDSDSSSSSSNSSGSSSSSDSGKKGKVRFFFGSVGRSRLRHL
jgi:translation initiation factor 3 subunit C